MKDSSGFGFILVLVRLVLCFWYWRFEFDMLISRMMIYRARKGSIWRLELHFTIRASNTRRKKWNAQWYSPQYAKFNLDDKVMPRKSSINMIIMTIIYLEDEEVPDANFFNKRLSSNFRLVLFTTMKPFDNSAIL